MENIKKVFYAIFKGFIDSLSGCISIFSLDKKIKLQAEQTPEHKPQLSSHRKKDTKEKKNVEPKVLERAIQCCSLNGGVFWFSILAFEYGLIPLVHVVLNFMGTDKFIWTWMQPILSWTFSAIWVLPLFLLSKAINSLWFQDIADSAYKYKRGKPANLSISKFLADMCFSIIVQALFLVQSMLVSMLPIAPVGQILYQIHMCLLYSLYAFEYSWINRGWELGKRLTYIQKHWPYFVGFGLPLTILTSLPNSYIISGCVFSILFPLFIISANEVKPVEGSCDFPLNLFAPVINVTNTLFNRTLKTNNLETKKLN